MWIKRVGGRTVYMTATNTRCACYSLVLLVIFPPLSVFGQVCVKWVSDKTTCLWSLRYARVLAQCRCQLGGAAPRLRAVGRWSEQCVSVCYLNPFTSQPVKFPSWMMQGRACKQFSVWVSMKILPLAVAKKKTKRLNSLSICHFNGRFQVTSRQSKG